MVRKQLGALALLAALLLSGCSGAGSSDAAPEQENTDPTAGWTTISDRSSEENRIGLWSICDGTTLIYSSTRWDGNSSGLAVEPFSTQCADAPIASALEDNSNPRTGWVTISDRSKDNHRIGLWKLCDGTTLVYTSTRWDGNASGLAIVPNDNQCVS